MLLGDILSVGEQHRLGGLKDLSSMESRSRTLLCHDLKKLSGSVNRYFGSAVELSSYLLMHLLHGLTKLI